ncbi:PH domain-containing protein [Micromonospora sp. NPDC005367]|uniref:PH domain-containing protein n=1 Tax=Micromonospora sp. NPDC005367 TaxID=3155590 RepID=UPI00339F1D68
MSRLSPGAEPAPVQPLPAQPELVEPRPGAPAPVGGSRSIGLRSLRHRVDRRAVRWWTVRAVLAMAPLVAAVATGHAVLDAARSWLTPLLVAVVAIALAYVAVVPSLRYAVYRWETTPEAVYAVSGWFVREWRAAPVSRIQTVDTVRGPVQRLFGLATVSVTTASAHGPVVLVGLDLDVADETARRLTEIVQRTRGDAT